MKKTLVIINILIAMSVRSSATVYHVLYIGNSLTYVNDVPSLVNQIAMSKGDSIIWDQNTPGGYQLAQHASNLTTLTKIGSYKWDIVVIQAQSQQTAFPDAQLETDVYPPCKFLVDSIHRNFACTRVMYYMPAGWKYGDFSNCPGFPAICTYEGQFERIRQTHLNLVDSTDASIIPSGVSYRVSRMADSTLDLWSSDNVHPSIAGSYLTALNMYEAFTNKTAIASTYIPAGLSSTNTSFLQGIADSVVFDSISLWKLDVQPAGNDSVYFTVGDMHGSTPKIYVDCGITTDSIYYIFNVNDELGDTINNFIVSAPRGQISFFVVFPDTFGCYIEGTITQVHIGPCIIDSTTKFFSSICEGINDKNKVNPIRIYPNPAEDIILLERKITSTLNWEIEIVDVSGRTLMQSNFASGLSSKILDISTLSAGMYYVVLIENGTRYASKLVKN